jgi:hypothetical protein
MVRGNIESMDTMLEESQTILLSFRFKDDADVCVQFKRPTHMKERFSPHLVHLKAEL